MRLAAPRHAVQAGGDGELCQGGTCGPVTLLDKAAHVRLQHLGRRAIVVEKGGFRVASDLPHAANAPRPPRAIRPARMGRPDRPQLTSCRHGVISAVAVTLTETRGWTPSFFETTTAPDWLIPETLDRVIGDIVSGQPGLEYAV